MKLSKTNNNISFEPSDSQDVSKEIKLSQAKRLFFFYSTPYICLGGIIIMGHNFL